MDPNNGLCNWIGASGACDYQRMYNFNNYPTANNGYSTGNNSIFAGNNTNVSYTSSANGAVTYSYNSGPPQMPLWAGLLLGVGMIGQGVGAYFQSQAMIEQQKQNQEKADKEYAAYQKKADALEARQNRQADTQEMIQTIAMLSAIKKLGKDDD